jgi:hypothetical protein
MGAYHVRLARTADNTLIVGAAVADATRPRRLKLYELRFGCDAAPADNMFRVRVRRTTTLGTGTSVTPARLDKAQAATEFDAAENHTVNPTFDSTEPNMIDQPTHQRNSFLWMAKDGREIVTPATASNGLGFETPVGPAASVVYDAYIEEE